MSQLFIWRGCVQSDDCTGPSLNLINRNVPQSNVTEPNKSNVVTVTVFGNLYEEKDTTDIVEKCPSSRLSYRLLATFLPEKQRLSPAKNFNSPSVPDGKKKSLWPSALRTETSVNFRKTASVPQRRLSVWIHSGELANRFCGFHASSRGSSSLRRCFALSERPSAENWWTTCGVNVASLCERGYLLLLIGLDLDRNLCRDSAFSHRETGSCIWVSQFRFWYVCRYSPSYEPWVNSQSQE